LQVQLSKYLPAQQHIRITSRLCPIDRLLYELYIPAIKSVFFYKRILPIISSGDATKPALKLLFVFTILSLFVTAASVRGYAATVRIASQTAEVNGVRLHYLEAGHGPAVILLHGYTQTSRMWKPIIPLLAERFTVIAPDLPGIGDSEIPASGLDMKTAAIRMRVLAKSLGVAKASVVGHDIGLMVAYADAAQFPADVEKLVVMDAFLPGVAGWKDVYDNPGI
jgi:hypothetical protein